MTLDEAIEALENLEDDVHITKIYDTDGRVLWQCWIDRPSASGVKPNAEGRNFEVVIRDALLRLSEAS